MTSLSPSSTLDRIRRTWSASRWRARSRCSIATVRRIEHGEIDGAGGIDTCSTEELTYARTGG